MLYLRCAETNADAHAESMPLAELTAVGLERALLAANQSTRVKELHAALARDPAAAAWAMQIYAARLESPSRSIDSPSLDEAVNWLGGTLPAVLSARLMRANGSSQRDEIDSRLPALAERLAAYERQLMDAAAHLEREKLESLKELAYGASHEINNPLANIAARAQTLLEEEANPERQRKLSAIHRQAMRAHEMIADLMLFARPPKLNLAECDVRHVARQVVDDLHELAEDAGTTLACSVADRPLVLRADTTQLAVAVHAVVVNALQAVGEGGNVLVHVCQSDWAGGEWAEIAVRDDGPGISEEVRQHMFDPFFSGREAGRGLGFGLSKCWRIVTDHGGEVIVRRPASGGAEIAMLLPRTSTAAAT